VLQAETWRLSGGVHLTRNDDDDDNNNNNNNKICILYVEKLHRKLVTFYHNFILYKCVRLIQNSSNKMCKI
jgi:hypothetical protein